MAARLSSEAFVLNLGVLYDCLEELCGLSEDLQDRDITLPRAHSLIYRTIRVFHSMVDHPGMKYKEVKNGVEKEKKIRNVNLQPSRRSDVFIPHGQFVRSLVDNLQKRLVVLRNGENDLSRLIKSIDSLNPSNWPEDCPLTYANDDVAHLCNMFSLDDRKTRRGFQEYIDNVQNQGIMEPPNKLLDLVKAVRTLPVSTAECERGFSQMNVLASSTRSSLTIKTLSAIMFIKCVGPPPQIFVPHPYVKTWITQNHCLADNSKARERKKIDELVDHSYSIIWEKLKT